MNKKAKTKVNIDIKKIDKEFRKAGRQFGKYVTSFIVQSAIKTYIPVGETGLLAQSLREKVKEENGKIKIEVIAQKEYAKKVHDYKLRHASNPAERNSFAEFGTGKTDAEKYNSGYETMKNSSPKYATKFLEKPIQWAISNLDKFVISFRRVFNKK